MKNKQKPSPEMVAKYTACYCPECSALTGGDDCWRCLRISKIVPDPNSGHNSKVRRYQHLRASFSEEALGRLLEVGLLKAEEVEYPGEYIPHNGFVPRNREPKLKPLSRDFLVSAQAFHLAISALPVGKDIRARLTLALDTHIADLKKACAA